MDPDCVGSSLLNVSQTFSDLHQVGGSVSASQARSKSVPTAYQQNAGAGATQRRTSVRPDSSGPPRGWNLHSRESGSQCLQHASRRTSNPNPVSLAREVSDSLGDTRLLGNFFADIGILRDLKFRVSVGADYANRFRNTYYPRTTLRGSGANGVAIRNSANTTSWINESRSPTTSASAHPTSTCSADSATAHRREW